ncbi:hypothetical protein [Cupriavidus malaysiensis]|nr:hypothetical protein [Cupriavidus malaysiensis]
MIARFIDWLYWRTVPTEWLYRDAMFSNSDGEPINASGRELCRRLREGGA